ncbi:MAG: DegT/DnrJ/EryC1/StrS family aminotransferase [Pseudonocardia sp.]|nr:DegT/DnrJ/EryC1/StrS family aminotransferase [Pseudonocardia sp.]
MSRPPVIGRAVAVPPGTPDQGVPFLDLGSDLADSARLRAELDEAWSRTVGSARFVGGPEVAAFEAEFAEYCGVANCVGVGNGTDALELVLAALGVGPGDEVVVPGATFVATAEAVVGVGAVPRFVDVRPDTLLLDPAAVEAAIGPRTVAVVAVHLYGQVADMDALAVVTRRHGLALVEDAAQAHGARLSGRRAGSIGVAAAFSFYPGKNLGALGDGGAVVTDDDALAGRVRRAADHGRSGKDRHVHVVPGRNSRLDGLQAAFLRVKLRGLDDANAARAAAMARYRAALPPGCVPLAVQPAAEPVHHLAVVQVEDRAAATRALTAADIGWGLHYPVPCQRQPAFLRDGRRPETLPVADAAAERVLSLPMFPTLTAEQVGRVCAVLASVPALGGAA